MIQTPGSEEQGHGGWLPVPHLYPGLDLFLPRWASSKGKQHPGHVSLVKEVFPDLLPVPPILGIGAVRAFDGSPAVLWGEHQRWWSCGGLAQPALWGCFRLTPGFKPPSWHLSGEEVGRSVGFISFTSSTACESKCFQGFQFRFSL